MVGNGIGQLCNGDIRRGERVDRGETNDTTAQIRRKAPKCGGALCVAQCVRWRMGRFDQAKERCRTAVTGHDARSRNVKASRRLVEIEQ